MIFKTLGNKNNPAVLFFHAMGVTGDSSVPLPEELQRHIYFEFGSVEEHYKYRDAVRMAYPHGNYPVFEGYNHMQYQIRDPEGFAEMLRTIMKESHLPELVFLKE